MRLLISFVLFAACGPANASSFAVVGEPMQAGSGSIIALGTPEPRPLPPASAPAQRISSIQSFPLPQRFHVLSGSVIAMEPDAVVTHEFVASVKGTPSPARPIHFSTPMVIRGGMVGEAFSGEGPAGSAPASTAGVQPSSGARGPAASRPPEASRRADQASPPAPSGPPVSSRPTARPQ